MSKLTVYDFQGKQVGSLDLPADFGSEVNSAVIHQAVVMYQANQRQGTLDTKIRSEISGGNKKPFRQKGTGRARQGSSRSPLNHHGGIVFGPHPRDFSYTLPRKVKLAALKESLKAKFQAEAICCVDMLALKKPSTKDFNHILKVLKLDNKKVVALFDDCTNEIFLASRNLPSLKVVRADELNALEVMKSKNILATKASIEKVLKRLQ